MRKTNIKNEKGITLIALVITIIILLILAGVAIAMLSGENSILNKVNSAKTENELAAEEEIVKLAVTTALANNTKIENAKAIDDNLEDEWTVTGSDGGPYICKNKNTNNAYSVDINGTVTILGKQTGNNIVYNEKYICTDGLSSMKGSYIIFSEDGSTSGTMMPSGMTVTYEVKPHTAIIEGVEKTFQNAFFVSMNGATAMFMGAFNDDYTELKILEEPEPGSDGSYRDEWMTLVVKKDESSIAYNEKYICTDGPSSMKGSYIIFSEDGSTSGTMMPSGMTVTYEVKPHTAIIGGVEKTFQNAFFASMNGATAMFMGAFNDDYTELKILHEAEPDSDGSYRDSWMTLVVTDGVEFSSYNTVYDNGMFQLVLYQNGMFTIGYTYYNNDGIQYGQYTGTYEYDKDIKELKINGICDDIDMLCTVSDDEKIITATCENPNFAGNYTKTTSSTYSYNPVYNDKGIYTNAIYLNDDKTNAISIGNEYIHLVQSGAYSNFVDTGRYGITIDSFDKDTNTTITVSNEGKTITYNGDEYNLVTLEDMNKASK